MLKVEWSKQAAKELDKIDFKIAQRLVSKISWLAQNFSYLTPEPLHGTFKGTYKLRVGDYRIVYILRNEIMVILSAGHRKEIYKG